MTDAPAARIAYPLVPIILVAAMMIVMNSLVDLLIQFLAPAWASADAFLWLATLGSAPLLLSGLAVAGFRVSRDSRTAVLAVGVIFELLLVLPAGLILPYLPTGLPLVLQVLTAALAHPAKAVHLLDIVRGVMFMLVWVSLAPAIASIQELSAAQRWPGDALQQRVDSARHWLTRWIGATTLALFLIPAALAHQLEREYLLASDVPVIGAALLYLSFGFCLIAWGNYTALQYRWQQGQRQVKDRFTGSWLLLSMTTVGVVAFLARLLPVNPVLNAPFPRRFFHDLKALLVGARHITAPVPPPRLVVPTPPLPAPLPVSPDASHMNWQLVILATSVVVVALLLVWLARQAKRTGVFSWLADDSTPGRLYAHLLRWMRRLSATSRRMVDQMTVASAQLLRRLQGDTSSIHHTVLYGETPDERVRYWYGRMLTAARRAGFPRHPGQSVTDYQKVLEAELPDGHDPLARLTALYSEARYSGRPTPPAQEDVAQTQYDRIRDAIRERPPKKSSG